MIEKLSKYKDLGIEISTIWGLKTETVSVAIGALGQVKKGLGKYVEKNSRKHQYRGTPKDQPFGYSPYFTKSAVYQLNNNTRPPHTHPPPPRRSQGNWLLLGALDSTNSES